MASESAGLNDFCFLGLVDRHTWLMAEKYNFDCLFEDVELDGLFEDVELDGLSSNQKLKNQKLK